MNKKSFLYGFLFLAISFVACTGSEKAGAKKNAVQQQKIKLPDSLSNKLAEGIDFFAAGSLPVPWTIEMDFDNGYYFKSSNGIAYSIPAVKPIRTSSAASQYTYKDRQGDMSILVYDAPCGENVSGKKVEVTVNNTRYSGCGNDLYNASINDSWILEKAGSITFNDKDFSKGLPRITFNVAENKMTGSDGCNSISGTIQMMGNRIKFSAISGLEGSCRNNVMQKIFKDKISNTVASYYFKDGKLYLYLIDDSTLVFKKA